MSKCIGCEHAVRRGKNLRCGAGLSDAHWAELSGVLSEYDHLLVHDMPLIGPIAGGVCKETELDATAANDCDCYRNGPEFQLTEPHIECIGLLADLVDAVPYSPTYGEAREAAIEFLQRRGKQ